MSYFARKDHENMEMRISLDELRDEGKALSFSDLVEISHHQEERFNMIYSLCYSSSGPLARPGQPKLSNNSRQQIVKTLLLPEVEKLAVIVTLLKYPIRTTEIEGSSVKWVGKTGRFQVRKINRKRKKYPIDVKISR